MLLFADGLDEGSSIDILIKRNGSTYKIMSFVAKIEDDKLFINPISSKKGLFQFRFTDVVDIVFKHGAQTWRWNNVKAMLYKDKEGTIYHTFTPTQRAILTNRRNTYRLIVSIRTKITYQYKVDLEAQIEDEDAEENAAAAVNDNFAEKKSEAEKKGVIFGGEPAKDGDNEKEKKKAPEFSTFAFINDLSEGGASISADVELGMGDVIGLNLEYKNTEVTAKGTIVRIIEENTKRGKFQYGIRYYEKSKNYVQFLFDEQRKYINDMKK
ncbi:MAG: PilZ domain-containing protein [Lachnospiraceae bacterium]|nr:PilZ domain-containing protein [Lachnospiraceae bacterium]